MISQYLKFRDAACGAEYRYEPKRSDDPFKLIDVLDPHGEHKEKIANVLDTIDKNMLEIYDSLYALSDDGISVVLDFTNCGLHPTCPAIDTKLYAAIFACLACYEGGYEPKIKFRPSYWYGTNQSKSFVDELMSQIVRVMEVTDWGEE